MKGEDKSVTIEGHVKEPGTYILPDNMTLYDLIFSRGGFLAGFVSLFLFVGLAFVLEFVSKINRRDEKYEEFFKNLDDIKRDFKRLTPPFKRKF